MTLDPTENRVRMDTDNTQMLEWTPNNKLPASPPDLNRNEKTRRLQSARAGVSSTFIYKHGDMVKNKAARNRN